MRLKEIYYDIVNTPFPAVIEKFKNKLKARINANKLKHLHLSTDLRTVVKAPEITYSYLKMEDIDVKGIDQKAAGFLCEMYLNHRVDLLGSGWVRNSYNSKALGINGIHYEGISDIPDFDKKGKWLAVILSDVHQEYSKKAWQEIFTKTDSYTPIDWQKDFKSGYRWDSKVWYCEQGNLSGDKPGTDIKVPWELARLQHLPQLAIFAKVLPERKNELITEFRSQALDFMAANPPNMGVNWACTMDVGIRLANLLIAFDLFRQTDNSEILNEEFCRIFSNSVYHHALFITQNLEYKESITTNHYLGNVAGLLFAAAYLENTEETSAWLAFAVQELVHEMDKQFLEDGGNYESSTVYHRLSGEMMVYCTALIAGLPEEKIKALSNYNPKLWKSKPVLKEIEEQKFDPESDMILPKWYFERLNRAVQFTIDLTKPTGEIPQIGDNDSGRFIKFSPCGTFITAKQAGEKYRDLKHYSDLDYVHPEELFWDENVLDHSTYVSAGLSLFEKDNGTDYVEKSIIQSFMKEKKPGQVDQHYKQPEVIIDKSFDALKYHQKNVLEPEKHKEISLKKHLKIFPYPDFGLYIFKSDRLHLTIACTNKHVRQYWGHSHNDKLSFELNMDGEDIIVDPGGYIYTALPEQRNLFRSVKHHNTLVVEEEEQNRWLPGKNGVFKMSGESRCMVLELTDDSITIGLKYRNIIQKRQFKVEQDKIIINDFSNVPFKVNFNRFEIYSNGYGKRIN